MEESNNEGHPEALRCTQRGGNLVNSWAVIGQWMSLGSSDPSGRVGGRKGSKNGTKKLLHTWRSSPPNITLLIEGKERKKISGKIERGYYSGEENIMDGREREKEWPRVFNCSIHVGGKTKKQFAINAQGRVEGRLGQGSFWQKRGVVP